MTRLERLARWTEKVRGELLWVDEEQRLTILQQRLAELPPDERRLCEDLFTVRDMVDSRRWKAKQRERWAAFIFGVAGIACAVLMAIVFPQPTPFQYQVFRILLSVSVAGAGAFIPGFLDVQVGKWVRAGGALAIFVVVYFWNPAELIVEKPPIIEQPK